VNEDLTQFWIRADLEDPVFTGDELRRLPAAIRRILETRSLVRQSENLRVIECDACGEGHLEEVEILVEPPGSKPRAYITCPEAGRVSVDLQRLQPWVVDLDVVARTVAATLDLRDGVVSIAPGRVWLLGKRRVGERLAEFFLARGTTWPDGGEVLQTASRMQASPAPIILCPNRLPHAAEWHQAGRTLFSLAEHTHLEDARLVIDPRDFEDFHRQIAERVDKPPDPTPVAERRALLKRYCEKNRCRVKDVYYWANVVREDLNKWKLGRLHLIPDTSEKAVRIEKLLQRNQKSRL
jgi:hypothetical protein